MAAINDLLRQVPDRALRVRLEEEIERLSKKKKYGLVFENHIPECTPLHGVGIKIGSNVARKSGPIDEVLTVINLDGDSARCYNKVTGETQIISTVDLVSVAQFGEPIFPMLQHVDEVQNAPDSSLWHALIEADNYHALQLLEYLYAGKVDCIYIDPPYNTGAGDWKYNDAFVDSADHWSHSKWLSMMKKRLVIAKRLLSKGAPLVISIGYQEVNRLHLLLEELFPERQVVTVTVQTSGGKSSGGFKYLHEYLLFVVPLDFSPNPTFFSGGKDSSPYHGMTLASFTQSERPNQTYPIYVKVDTGEILGCGKSLQARVKDGSYTGALEDFQFDYDEAPEGCVAVWPVSTKGAPCVWRLIPSRFMKDVSKGYIRVVPQNKKKTNSPFGIQFLADGVIKKINAGELEVVGRERVNNTIKLGEYKTDGSSVPTIWSEKSFYTAKGTTQIQDIFGGKEFPYPKPLDLITEVLRACTNPDSLIVDFFAGSGTTLNAVNLLNEQDEGNRRCILVTNNEVSKKQEKQLRKENLQPGDVEWERQGICQSVTWPRTVYTITGVRADGSSLDGDYGVDEEGSKRLMSDGFSTNVEYFRLGFLDKDSVTLGRQFKEILPLLWLKTGAVGKRPECGEQEPEMMVLPENEFAILADETRYAKFTRELDGHDEIKTVFFVTDSEDAFREMSVGVPGRKTHHLYREYIENFVIGSRRA